MTVKDAIDLLFYGTAFFLEGAYSGKVYHRSWINTKEHLRQFYDIPVYSSPFFADINPQRNKYASTYSIGVIGIYIHDRMLAKCSVCGFDLGFITNFCPNCGADMRGE